MLKTGGTICLSAVMVIALALPAGGELICRTDTLKVAKQPKLIFPNNETADLGVMTYDGIDFSGDILEFWGAGMFFQAIPADYDSLESIPESTVMNNYLDLMEIRCSVSVPCRVTDYMENMTVICSTATGHFAKMRIHNRYNRTFDTVIVEWAYQTDGSRNVNTKLVVENAPSASTRRLSIFPNPANNDTRIYWRTEKSGPMRLEAFDPAGRRLAVLDNAYRSAGEYEMKWNPGTRKAMVYFIRLTAGNTVETVKGISVK